MKTCFPTKRDSKHGIAPECIECSVGCLMVWLIGWFLLVSFVRKTSLLQLIQVVCVLDVWGRKIWLR